MLLTRRSFFRLFFGAEVIVFVVIYFFGANGLGGIALLRKKNKLSAVAIQELYNDVRELEGTVYAWQNNSFYKEKIARERLHMARKGDTVYLTT